MARNLLLVMGISALFTVGCSETKSEVSMTGENQALPQRPAELDKLATWVGNWTFSGDCTMAGMDKPITMSGTSSAAWEVDRWCLVEKVEGPNMIGPGMFSGMAVHTYDPHARKFMSVWMDNMGSVNHGTMWQDSPNTWKTKGTGRNVVTGEKTTSDGWMKMVDANTIEWGGTEYCKGKKMMEMKGTSKRRM